MPVIQEEEPEAAPLDMSWPGTWRERATYVLVLPIILPLWMTLPDTRKESCKVESVALEAPYYSSLQSKTNRQLNINKSSQNIANVFKIPI